MAKWKVGDWIGVKGAKGSKILVVEVMEQTCYAGVQTHYKGRVYSKSMFNKDITITRDTWSFLEIELEDLLIMKISDELKALIDKLKKERAAKEKLIKSQDFEKAAEHRKEQTKLALQIEAQCEKEGIDINNLDLHISYRI